MPISTPLTARDEDILKAVAYYRYLTARDITNLNFASSSITHVREILAKLSGGTDLAADNYLCRFSLPVIQNGPREKVYVLGSRGRRALGSIGIATPWYFRPSKLKFLSFSYVLHNLILSRFLIAAQAWCRQQPDFTLIEKRISYELSGKIIPDGWMKLEERRREGIFDHAILFEIDRGMETKAKFQDHVRQRIAFIRFGDYRTQFQTDLVTIAYATTGQTREYREARVNAMRGFIMGVLRDQRMESWASVFRVTSLEFTTLYEHTLFEKPVWQRPDSPEPVMLFAP